MNILKNTKALIVLSVVVAAIGGSQVYACRDTFAALAHEKTETKSVAKKETSEKKVSPSVKKESSSESSATETSSVSESSSSVAQSSSVASSSSDAQSSSQATTQAQTATQQSSQTTQAQSQAQQSSSQQPAQTSGFCLNGHSYPIRSFSGTGSVPADGNVYAWTSLPNYYLFEMMGAAHSQLGSLHVGSEVVINGRVLHVSEIMYGVKNDGTGLEVVSNKLAQHSAGWQTCEQACYNSTLTVWFAD
ncbi:hypothetical protein AAAV91_03495 [Ligilactobacillus ruminis]|uniref:hypothetical protein n=1 Tax=Ligilactobacillus ruminis TaxID=1623 RepID=UPI00189B10AF|nr:hypothetical protein [Ligilactobacillus ruminis]